MFAPHCKSLQDIYGRADLNAVLKNHPQIEQLHHKLYLTSSVVLNRLLHAGCLSQSYADVAQAQAFATTFVLTPYFDTALRLLETQGVCVLTGGPGLGKSTLSDALMLYYSKEGYTVTPMHELSDDVPAAAKRLVYFDDFLGATYLRQSDERMYAKLMGLVRRCVTGAAIGTPRILLNCRTYLFESAKAQDLLEHRGLKLATYECKLDPEEVRKSGAAMLRNHVNHAAAGGRAHLRAAQGSFVHLGASVQRSGESSRPCCAHLDCHSQHRCLTGVPAVRAQEGLEQLDGKE
jgi:hypothetical protein